MALELIKFNNLKLELKHLEELYNLDKDKKLLLQIKTLKNKLNKSKIKFIKEFRKNNVNEINKYLNLKDRD